MDICGAVTSRGNPCKIPRKKCIFHQNVFKKKYFPSQRRLYNFKGRRICGIQTTGHSQRGRPCQHQVKRGENYCIYHSYLDQERKEVASILIELSKGNNPNFKNKF